MSAPDFNKKTVETLAKRARYLCSNPDCRVSTVGPNSDPEKATVIGEAAHIFGARPNAKRFVNDMDDPARASITNGIWLCRNCHKCIDIDEEEYSSGILFLWREEHEKYVQADLGNKTDKLRYEQQNSSLSLFKDYPPLIRRIVIDKPDGWEWRLTAELMRYLNKPHFRKLRDLRDGLCTRLQEHISDDDSIDWISQRLSDAYSLSSKIEKLLDRLTQSWGEPGEPGESGKIEEIFHICCLISNYLEQVIAHEEKLYFASVPDRYLNIINLLKDCWGSQAEKLESIPKDLDNVVSMIGTDHGGTIEDPLVIQKTIVFELPEGWEKKMDKELSKLGADYRIGDDQAGGFKSIVVVVLIILLIWAFL